VSTVAGIVVPFVSIVVGAGITYVINVRQRRRNYVEDLMNAAIASVATAEVSVDFLASAAPSPQRRTRTKSASRAGSSPKA
jgi:hypothetical protein